MRVLMLCKACVVGIYQRKLAEIAAQGVDLRVLVPPVWRDERGETPLERLDTTGYELVTTPITLNGNYHLHFYPRLGQQIRDFAPHIIHIDEEPYNLSTWQALVMARRSGAKALFFSWQNIRRDYPPPFAWGEAWTLRHVDYAIAGTESAAAVWRGKGYTGPLAVIPQFGVDPALFRPAAEPAPRPFTIGYFGRLVAEKGLDTLLHAAASLDGIDWQLRLVGSGPERDTLHRLAQSLGIIERVTFCDGLPSAAMPDQYRQIDALVLPSRTRPNWKEQFGRVLVEAMSSGVPVVGSDSGAIPDVIGDAGLVFPEGDAAALAGHLRALAGDVARRESLAAAGRARVRGHFTHRAIAAATVAVYRTLHGESKTAG